MHVCRALINPVTDTTQNTEQIEIPGPVQAPPISFATDIVGIIGITILVAFLMYPVLDGKHTLMSDSWRLHYPWAVESEESVILDHELADDAIETAVYHPEEPKVLAYDIYLESVPWFEFAQKELQEGRWPHWNPYSFSGAPLYANHLVPVTHPPLLIALLTAPPIQIHTVATFLTWWLAGLGMYFLLRRRRMQPSTGLAVTALYLTCGHYMPLVPFQMSSLMYYPWIFLVSDMIDEKPSAGKLFWLSLLIALQMMAGHPAYVAPFYYLVILHRILLWGFNRKPLKHWGPRLGLILLGLIFGALMSLPQNLPTLNLTGLSARELAGEVVRTVPSGGTNAVNSAAGFADIIDKALIVFSPAFRPDIEKQHPYTGVPLILLALLGLLFTRPPPDRNAYLTLLLIFMVLSFPPVFIRVAHILPGLGISPYTPFATVQFILVLLAGVGLEGLNTDWGNISKKVTLWLIAAGAIGLLVYLYPQLIDFQAAGTGAFIIGGLSICLIIHTVISKAKYPYLSLLALPLLLTLTGVLSHHYQYPVFPELPVMPSTPSMEVIPSTSEFRVIRHTSKNPLHKGTLDDPLTFGGNLPMWAGWYDSQGYDSFVMENQWRLLTKLAHGSLAWNGLAFPVTEPDALTSPILNALSVKWVITDDPDLLNHPNTGISADDWTLLHDGGFVIYEKTNAVPRWYLTDNAIYVRNADEAIESLATMSGDVTGVIIETDETSQTGFESVVQRENHTNISPGSIQLVSETSQEMRFTVDTDHDTWFVLSDTWHPNWRAILNGNEVEILKANTAFRAVMIPVGQNELIFEYVASDFNRGILISLLITGLLLSAWIGEYYSRLRKTKEFKSD